MSMSSDFVRNNLPILLLALAAGFLIALNSASVLLILIALAGLWLLLDNFEGALMLLVFYLPFQVALNVSSGMDLASGRVLILLFFLIWIFRSLERKKLEIDFSLETMLVVLFLALSVFSYMQVVESDRAIRKLLVLFSVFPLYFVLTSFAGRKDLVMRSVKALMAGGLVIGTFGVLQFLAQFIFGINPLFDFFAAAIAPVFYGKTFAAQVVANPSWLVNVGGNTLLRAFAIFSDPHIFSFYIGLVVPSVLALLLLPHADFEKLRLGKSKAFVFLAFLTLLLSELFTFSRGSYLGMSVAGLVFLVLFWKAFSHKQKRSLLAGGVLALLFVSVISSSILSRFLSSFDSSEGSNVERLKNWRQGWETFSDNIFQGVGIGNYSYYLDPTLGYRTPVYAHNLYLDLGAELGVFALIAWVLLIIVTICELYAASKATKDRVTSYLSLSFIVSLAWYSVHSFFDTSIYAPNILAMLVVILSLSVMTIREVKSERGK